MEMYKLLVVDDDQDIALLLKELLELENFKVEVAYTGEQALDKFDSTFDLILLEIMMPKINGFSMLSQLRIQYNVPIIFLTAKNDDFDKIIAFELGADDYISKPFKDRELIARIKALLRRHSWSHSFNEFIDKKNLYNIDKLTVNPLQQTVSFDGQYIDLTSTEFQVLLHLLERAGRTISKNTLFEKVLGKTFEQSKRSIDVHVSNLRKKLPPRTDGLPWIKTLRSKGYLFVIDNNDNKLVD